MEKRVVIAGSRYYEDYDRFCWAVDKCLSVIKNEYEIIIVSGHCRGTDLMAERYAAERGYGLEIFPADWSLGKKAGPVRNKQMVEVADFAIAFYSGGNGTKNLIKSAMEKTIPIKIIKV